MLFQLICLVQGLAFASAQSSGSRPLSKARELRQRLTFTSDQTRRNQLRHRRAQIFGVYNSQTDYSQIVGLSIIDFDKILSSDVAYEFGARERNIGLDRAEELWEDAANFQLDLAVEAEERWVAGDADYGRGDAEYPYIVCSKKPRKSALERKKQLVNIAVYGADDLEYEESKLFTSKFYHCGVVNISLQRHESPQEPFRLLILFFRPFYTISSLQR